MMSEEVADKYEYDHEHAEDVAYPKAWREIGLHTFADGGFSWLG